MISRTYCNISGQFAEYKTVKITCVIIGSTKTGLHGYPEQAQGINKKITPVMKTIQNFLIIFFVPLSLALISCTEELPNVTGKNHLYRLTSTSTQKIDGQVKIRERFDGTTQLELVLENTNSNQTYLAYIHFGNALDGGGVAITLTPVDGHSKTSVTEISNMDSGTPISYQELLEFDGHLNIQAGGEPGVMVAQADIGKNALTGKFAQYTLQQGDVEGAKGLLTIQERESGFSLVTVEIEGGTPGKQHPVTLNLGSVYQQAGIAGKLNPVDGTLGLGRTNLERLDGELMAPYDAIITFKGFVRVHMGQGPEMSTVIAQGNIAYDGN
jgi:hypothetical protein